MTLLRVLPVIVFTLFIAWVISQANTNSDNIIFQLVGSLRYGDKLSHFTLYGLLSVLAVVASNYHQIKIYSYYLPTAAIIVLLLAIIEEITQLFIINRTFDLIDVLADIMGIMFFMLLLKKYKRKSFTE